MGTNRLCGSDLCRPVAVIVGFSGGAREAWRAQMAANHGEERSGNPAGIWIHPDGSLTASEDTRIALSELFAELDKLIL